MEQTSIVQSESLKLQKWILLLSSEDMFSILEQNEECREEWNDLFKFAMLSDGAGQYQGWSLILDIPDSWQELRRMERSVDSPRRSHAEDSALYNDTRIRALETVSRETPQPHKIHSPGALNIVWTLSFD